MKSGIDNHTNEAYRSDMVRPPSSALVGLPRAARGPVPGGEAGKCHRHDWPRTVAGLPWPARCVNCLLVTEDPDAYFLPDDTDEEVVPDDILCPSGGLHVLDEAIRCLRCGKPRDEARKRRNKNNRARGANFERTVAKALGGRRTGPLGGRDDVVVGTTLAVQTKKDLSLSLNKARVYLDDLTRTFPGRTALVVHSKPGRGGQPVVILALNDWIALHGQDGMSEDAA